VLKYQCAALAPRLARADPDGAATRRWAWWRAFRSRRQVRNLPEGGAWMAANDADMADFVSDRQ
jgi:hypothetical protein